MTALGTLRVLTLAAAGACLAGLAWLTARAFAFGRRVYLSEPRGRAGRGLLYAFGKGMADKESVSRHLPTMLGGVVYHTAIFAALLDVVWTALPVRPGPPPGVFRPVLLAGAVVGPALLAKRAAKPHLRRLSCPDDFFANLFVDVFLALAFLRTVIPSLETALLAVSILLFFYIPLGKIRHCVFFFFTRVVFGLHFGRRGALPGSESRA
ncbi:MAG TPA: hypothetical protein PLP83_08300 [Candidatus Aminicenantes bacterium]|nr:hypothetical protein [Candidatus Aminicenantes bacterium]